MTSEALHDFLSNKNMLGAISKATPGNNALKDILTEAMESIHQLDGDEVQRLLANATPRSRRMSTASDTAFSGQVCCLWLCASFNTNVFAFYFSLVLVRPTFWMKSSATRTPRPIRRVLKKRFGNYRSLNHSITRDKRPLTRQWMPP